MRTKSFLLLIVFSGIAAACSGSHSIGCVEVGRQKVCFVREVWGLNGDEVALTTSKNVCHKLSKEYDYVSNVMRGQEVIFCKVIDGKLHVLGESMDEPENKFPVEIVFERYDPTKPDRDLPSEGYQGIDLSSDKMTWCFSDAFW